MGCMSEKPTVLSKGAHCSELTKEHATALQRDQQLALPRWPRVGPSVDAEKALANQRPHCQGPA